jgi:hypothetical protein
MPDKKEIQEAVQKIKEAAQKGHVRFPAQVEKHPEIFPIKVNEPLPRQYEFSHVTLGYGFGPRKDRENPQHDHHGGFVLHWGAKGVGFGELTFRLKGGQWDEDMGEAVGDTEVVCDSEGMGPEFIQQALIHFAKTLKIEG